MLKNHADIEFGAHLHSDPISWYNKVDSAFHAGCRRFDGALLGIGGCPMAKDQLIGNMPTEKIIDVLSNSGERLEINHDVLKTSLDMAKNIFI